MSNLRSLVQKLRDDGYVIIDIHHKYQFTDKFYADLDVVSTGEELGLVVQDKGLMTMPKSTLEWELLFSNFILEAKIPRTLEDNRGQMYYANKASKDGLKEFRKALERGVVYPVLVKSTMLYYLSSVKYKKAIGNYFAQGDWRSDYEALLSSAETGTIESHIKTETQHGGLTGYSLG